MFKCSLNAIVPTRSKHIPIQNIHKYSYYYGDIWSPARYKKPCTHTSFNLSGGADALGWKMETVIPKKIKIKKEKKKPCPYCE